MSVKTAFVAAVLATAVVAERDYEAMFAEFKSTHLKAYPNAAEESTRKQNFISNMKKAELYQAANPHAKFGPNIFADMSAAEFKSRHNAEASFRRSAMQPRHNEYKLNDKDRKAAAGQKIDWRAKGAVTGVKDQGQCGGCWSFSATGNIEGQWFIAGHNLTSLSEQEFISCDTTDQGCNGGLEYDGWEWIIENRHGQVVTEEAFPYASGSGYSPACPSNLNSMTVGAVISSFTHIAKSEDALASYCYASGPASIGVDASSFQMYTSGILTNCISQYLDHSVLVVGFDDTSVPPYWIVKNSWGTSWGEAGYIRIAKGSNQCLIKEDASSSIVKKSE